MSADWADDRAFAWCAERGLSVEKHGASLATLLREARETQFADRCVYPHWCQDEHAPLGFRGDDERCPACRLRDTLLADVRSVVEEVGEGWHPRGTFANAETAELVIQLILHRLEAL